MQTLSRPVEKKKKLILAKNDGTQGTKILTDAAAGMWGGPVAEGVDVRLDFLQI